MSLTYSRTELDAIVERHRQLSAAEHRKFVGIWFLLGALLVWLIL